VATRFGSPVSFVKRNSVIGEEKKFQTTVFFTISVWLSFKCDERKGVKI